MALCFSLRHHYLSKHCFQLLLITVTPWGKTDSNPSLDYSAGNVTHWTNVVSPYQGYTIFIVVHFQHNLMSYTTPVFVLSAARCAKMRCQKLTEAALLHIIWAAEKKIYPSAKCCSNKYFDFNSQRSSIKISYISCLKCWGASVPPANKPKGLLRKDCSEC